MEEDTRQKIVWLANGLEPRDTSTLTPQDLPSKLMVGEALGYAHAKLELRSTLDQAVDVQLRGILEHPVPGKPDQVERVSYDIGQAVTVDAGSTTEQEDSFDIAPAMMMPRMFIEVTAQSSPTSGQFNAWLTLLWPIGRVPNG